MMKKEGGMIKMVLIKKVARIMIERVKETNYNCSPAGFYKPKKLFKKD